MDKLPIRGFFRLQLTAPGDDAHIVGDSGWVENQITNVGYLNIVNQLGTGLTGTKISHMALGTGGTVSGTSTSLPGEVSARAAITAASNGSTGLQMTATFASSASFVTATVTLSNVGLFPASAASTLLAGNTISSSACATNQNANMTYLLTFA